VAAGAAGTKRLDASADTTTASSNSGSVSGSGSDSAFDDVGSGGGGGGRFALHMMHAERLQFRDSSFDTVRRSLQQCNAALLSLAIAHGLLLWFFGGAGCRHNGSVLVQVPPPPPPLPPPPLPPPPAPLSPPPG